MTVIAFRPESERNPFQLPPDIQALVYGTAAGAGGAQQQISGLTVEGYIWGADTPQAIINGNIYHEGDFIGGVRILKIDKSGIIVEQGGQKTLLK